MQGFLPCYDGGMTATAEPQKGSGRVLTEAVFVRLRPDDYAAFSAAAEAEDRTLAAWLRRQGRLAVGDREAKRP